jgi:hypothetical protein
MTIEKLLPLESLEAGQYTLRIKVTDTLKNETLTQQTEFTIS